MKFFALLFSVLFLNVQSLDMDTVRNSYQSAANDKSKVDGFYELLSKVTKQSSVELVAYKGASIAIKAKYGKTIKDKKSEFIEGISYVEYAIEKSPNNVETRFVRLGIQENSPKLLKYKNNIDEDKLFILKQYEHIKSASLKKHIKDFAMQSTVFSDDEKKTFE